MRLGTNLTIGKAGERLEGFLKPETHFDEAAPSRAMGMNRSSNRSASATGLT